MSVNELKKYILKSKYARHNKQAQRRETYSEAVDRVRNMMLDQFPQAADAINWAYDEVEQETALGSQRAMQYGGHPVIQHNARIYNCTCSYADRLRFFQEAFYLLLCGCGVGFSVQKHHVAKLPAFSGQLVNRIRNPFIMVDSMPSATFVVPDTIEGWADALGVLISCYFEDGPFPEYYGHVVTFDFSLIRAEGSPLSSGAGKAPGPEPLMRALREIENLLKRCLANGQERLRPIDVYDIVMHASDAVLAGGVRRSATICVFSPDDVEMAKAKTGNWLQENPQRARSNNSCLLVRGETSYEQFEELMGHVKQWGEPGFVWADSTEFLVNPCVEIGMWPRLKVEKTDSLLQEVLRGYKGPIGYDDASATVSGWQFCNLTTVNGNKVKTPDDFYKGCRVAAILGTLQAAFTKFPYLGRVTEEIVRKEALLGVSITSVMSCPDILLDPEVLRRGAEIVLETNEWLSKILGTNPCARGTCMKPEGTGTLMLGSLACGAHGWPFKKGIKNVQANVNEVVYQWLRESNEVACQKSVWCRNGTTDVISFPVEAPETALLENDMSAVEFLGAVKNIYMNWVVPGKRPERCTHDWLHHSVSNTVKVKPHEWEEVTRYIYENRECFAGISLLPFTGDKDYEQAPNIAVYDYDEMSAMYGEDELLAAICHTQTLLYAFGDDLFAACDAILGTPRQPLDEQQETLLKSILQERETSQKRLNFTYALKDLMNWKRYCYLKDSFKSVDYESLIEVSDDTQPTAEGACAGGACLI
jgi:ribonucleoside-diphosphate reductase alpha chain